ncbi:MAG: DUF1134 domain-containing protein [Alteraurantiacibacter sp.]
MLIHIVALCRTRLSSRLSAPMSSLAAAALLLGLVALPAGAQGIQSVDPDAAIDADLSQPAATATAGTSYSTTTPSTRYSSVSETYAEPSIETYPAPTDVPVVTAAPSGAEGTAPGTPPASSTTYAQDDLIGAAEGLFGKGAEGLARLIQDVLKEQGEPNGYIVGREGGGAFIFGVRYGSGTLYHRIEGNMPVYWTGPSIGFDVGANAGNTFVLVYNLEDSADLYRRFPAGEGQAYFVGGFTASYLRRGDTVLIPIRVGAGLRLGVNAGYMRFSHEQRWLPF